MLKRFYLGSVTFQFAVKMGDTFWSLVWVTMDQEKSLGALLSTIPILWVSFGRLEDIGGGLGASRLALWARGEEIICA